MRAAKTAAVPLWRAAPAAKAAESARPQAQGGAACQARRRPRRRDEAGWLSPWCLGYLALFVAGHLGGVLAGQLGVSELGKDLAAYYMDSTHYTAFSAVFLGLYSGAFLQLSAVALCGFSALGGGFLAAFFALKGAVFGLCAAGVFARGGARGLVVYWLMTCLPELCLLLLTLWLAVCAQRLAAALLRSLGGGGLHARPMNGTKTLLLRYFTALVLGAAVCAAGGGSAVFFAGVLL